MTFNFFKQFSFLFNRFYFFFLFKKGKGREKDRERNINVWEKHQLLASCLHRNWDNPGMGWQGIKPVTFWFAGQCSSPKQHQPGLKWLLNMCSSSHGKIWDDLGDEIRRIVSGDQIAGSGFSHMAGLWLNWMPPTAIVIWLKYSLISANRNHMLFKLYE